MTIAYIPAIQYGLSDTGIQSFFAASPSRSSSSFFVLCAKYFLKPGETSPGHIKRRILE